MLPSIVLNNLIGLNNLIKKKLGSAWDDHAYCCKNGKVIDPRTTKIHKAIFLFQNIFIQW